MVTPGFGHTQLLLLVQKRCPGGLRVVASVLGLRQYLPSQPRTRAGLEAGGGMPISGTKLTGHQKPQDSGQMQFSRTISGDQMQSIHDKQNSKNFKKTGLGRDVYAEGQGAPTQEGEPGHGACLAVGVAAR